MIFALLILFLAIEVFLFFGSYYIVKKTPCWIHWSIPFAVSQILAVPLAIADIVGLCMISSDESLLCFVIVTFMFAFATTEFFIITMVPEETASCRIICRNSCASKYRKIKRLRKRIEKDKSEDAQRISESICLFEANFKKTYRHLIISRENLLDLEAVENLQKAMYNLEDSVEKCSIVIDDQISGKKRFLVINNQEAEIAEALHEYYAASENIENCIYGVLKPDELEPNAVSDYKLTECLKELNKTCKALDRTKKSKAVSMSETIRGLISLIENNKNLSGNDINRLSDFYLPELISFMKSYIDFSVAEDIDVERKKEVLNSLEKAICEAENCVKSVCCDARESEAMETIARTSAFHAKSVMNGI